MSLVCTVKTFQGHMAAQKGVCSLCARSRTSSHFTSSIIDGLPWWGKAHCACLAAWLDGWMGGCLGGWLCWHVAPVFSGVCGRRREGQEPAAGEVVGTDAGQADFRHPRWRFSVIDWTCLMHWDQLNGHRCASPAPQTHEADESVYTEGWSWFRCHLGIWLQKGSLKPRGNITLMRLSVLWIHGLLDGEVGHNVHLKKDWYQR